MKYQFILSHFFEPTAKLEVPLAEVKTEGVSSVLPFLGIETDTTLCIFCCWEGACMRERERPDLTGHTFPSNARAQIHHLCSCIFT